MDRQGFDAGDELARGVPPAVNGDGFADPSWFVVEEVHPDVVAAQQRVIDVHTAWTDQQLAKGPVPFHPEEHPAHSDYNLHNVELEADGDALDDLAVASAIAQAPPPTTT